ncbi:NAD(P)H-dependent oxidoreductase [Maricaulis sp.]|uniref:FMN-dependent NADH-azoreductase n=1 Tax=Maricaulis sp. TaxID=1486257 RepID=UPI002611714C|nr:NAD(P)H-dependent oxidoreductase [Maricaulis sp.]
MNTSINRILRVDGSMRKAGSQSRALTDQVIERLSSGSAETLVTRLDLAEEKLAFVDDAWINANFTDPADRTAEQKDKLAASDALVAQVKAADTLVIGTPIYNFSVPAAVKAWIDMIARARETFRYTENGPEGLLEGKKAIIVITSGGTPVGSEIDYATNYLRHVMGFIGITDVTIVDAGRLNFEGEEKLASATADIGKIAA